MTTEIEFRGEPVSPEEMVNFAEVSARNVLRLPEADRLEWMADCKRNHPVLHAMIVNNLKDIREQLNRPAVPRKPADWLRGLMCELMPDKYPKPEDNLGWGI